MDDEPVNLTWLTKTKSYPFPIPSYIDGKPRKTAKEKTGRPPQSLAVLIYEAFRVHRSQLTVSQIADSIARKYDYYRIRKQWTITGTIRNALSKDSRFKKLPKDVSMGRRANYWILENAYLWQEIIHGTAPWVKNEDELRSELARRYDLRICDPFEDVNNNPTHIDEATNWEDVEVCKLGDDIDQEIQEILKSSDFSAQRHPWAEDTNVESEWIF